MSKIVAIGDTHSRSYWKLIKSLEPDASLYIFIGDYLDSYDPFTPIEQLHNLNEIIEFKKENTDKVILLRGNHDLPYHPEIQMKQISGYQAGAASNYEYTFNLNREYFQMAYAHDNTLFTHAGVGETWMKNCIEQAGAALEYPELTAEKIAEFVNEMWEFKSELFSFCGWRDPYGDEIGQTPCWIRPRALLQDTKEIREAGIVQIVGHTQVSKIDVEGSKKNTGGKLFMIDALGTSREYLVIENNKFIVKKC